MASENDRKKPAAENVEHQTSSARSVRKTKQPNSPKTATRPARRKATNTFQPASVGMLLRRIAYDADGRAIPGIGHLFNSLTEHFNSNDPVTLLLIELLVTDYARLAKAISEERLSDYGPQYVSIALRCINSAHKGVETSVKTLRELESERAEAGLLLEEAPPAETGEWVMSPGDLRCPAPSQEELLRVDDRLMDDWPAPSTPTPPTGETTARQTDVAESARDPETHAVADAAPAHENEQCSVPTPTSATDSATAAPSDTAPPQAADDAATGDGNSEDSGSPKAA